MARCTVALSAAWLRHDVDVVELAHLAQQPLGRRRVEGGERRAGQVVGGPEARQPGDGERLRRALEEDAHVLTHPEVVLLRRAEVHHDVVRRRRGGALGQPQLRELRVGVEGDAEGRGPTRRDRLAVGCDVLRVAGDRSVGRFDAGHAPDGRQHGLGDGVAGGRATTAELRHAAHLEVDVLVDVAEQRVERVVQRVGEDERSGNERHADHDGQRGEGQPQLVREQSLDGHTPHVRSPGRGCAPAPSRRSAGPARRRCCRRPGRRPDRRRPPRAGRASP